jgi:hypothetical protein
VYIQKQSHESNRRSTYRHIQKWSDRQKDYRKKSRGFGRQRTLNQTIVWNATTPDLSNTGITGAILKPIINVSYPDRFSVKFDWELDASSCNGMLIAEYGLFASEGTLFARKTSEVIQKDNTINLAGSWIIKFDN